MIAVTKVSHILVRTNTLVTSDLLKVSSVGRISRCDLCFHGRSKIGNADPRPAEVSQICINHLATPQR